MSVYATPAELEAGLDDVREAPPDRGTLELSSSGRRWASARCSTRRRSTSRTASSATAGARAGRSGGRPANVNAQVTLMSARAAALVAGERERWPLAGDQLYVDLDLSGENLPPGTRLADRLGRARGDATSRTPAARSSRERFGLDAMVFVNSPEGRALNLRGINTRVVEAGTVRVGDDVTKL